MAKAITYQWAGGAGPASWMVAANWMPAGIPGTGDIATIYAGSVFIPDGTDMLLQRLNLSEGGHLVIEADASLTLSGGTHSRRIEIFSNGGGATLTNYGTLSATGSTVMGVYVKNGAFTNHGTVTITDSGGFGGMELRDNSTLTNYGALTIQDVNSGDAFHLIESTAVVYNHGSMLLQDLNDGIFGYLGTHFHNYGLMEIKNEDVLNNWEFVIDGEGGLDFHHYANATLKGSGRIGLDALYLTGGIVAPTEDDGGPGIITLICPTTPCSEQNLTNGTLLFDIDGTAGAGVTNGHDQFTFNQQAHFQSGLTIDLDLGAGYTPQAGHSFVLMTYPSKTGAPTFSLPALPANLTWITSVTATQIVVSISISCPLVTFYADGDGDTYGNAAVTVLACSPPTGYVANSTDCNDANPAIHPGAAEVCNNLDDDCSGSPEAAANTWTGNGNGINWSDPNNWSDGIVPLACQDVVLTVGSNVRVAAGVGAVGKTLHTPLSAQLHVPASATLTIQN